MPQIGQIPQILFVMFVVMLVWGARRLLYVAVLQSRAETIKNLCLLRILQAILQQLNTLAVHSKGTS